MVKTFTYDQLFNFSKNIFLKIGCSEADATTAAQSLLFADLRGVDSHGVARLSGYIRLWEVQRENAKPNIKIVHETLAVVGRLTNNKPFYCLWLTFAQ